MVSMRFLNAETVKTLQYGFDLNVLLSENANIFLG